MQEFFLISNPKTKELFMVAGIKVLTKYPPEEGYIAYKLPELEEVKSVEIEVKMKEKKK